MFINMNALTGFKDCAWHFRARIGRLRALTSAPQGGICAEIGVWKGDFSRRILQFCHPQQLHLVDPWQFAPQFPDRWYGGALARNQADMDAIFESVEKRFHQNQVVSIHRACSTQAVDIFRDHYFDWIYIDGDHSFESVLSDLKLWNPKVKPNGVIALDDYNWRDESHQPSVKLAIEAFLATNKVKSAKSAQGQYLIRIL